MIETTVIIPNINGMKYLQACLDSLYACEKQSFPVIVVDNGSTDGSVELIRQQFPRTELICFPENRGFCEAVNAGILAAKTPYVILLNNDMTVAPGFVSYLTESVKSDAGFFSLGAKILSMQHPELIDDAGDYYCALGWAFARGKGKSAQRYQRPCEVFAACAGAAIYRRDLLCELGLFDEAHFAYLEDMDIGYRAKLSGYRNRFEPRAQVYHAGSATSGSRYNEFKVRLSARNSVYLIGKNMPALQILLNLPFLLLGFSIKYLFFVQKGFGRLYLKGLWKGVQLSLSAEGRKRRVTFRPCHILRCLRIEGELLYNLLIPRIFSL